MTNTKSSGIINISLREKQNGIHFEVSKIQRDLIKEVLKENKDLLANGMGDAGSKVIFNAKELVFNGIEGASHETFAVKFGKQEEFEFCKTAQKPYDLAVCKCLLILSLSKGFTFSSDGDLRDWQEALAWFSKKGFDDSLNKKVMPSFPL